MKVADGPGSAGTSGAGRGGAASTGGSNAAGEAGAPLVGGDAGEGGVGGGDAGDSGDSGAAGEGGAAGEPGEVVQCASGGSSFVAGNYRDAVGNQLLLRAGAKATTFALVPAGAPSPSKAPRLFSVAQTCAPSGALIATDASKAYRFDFVQAGNRMAICLSAAASTVHAAAILEPADASRSGSTGCAGKPFTEYTMEAQ